MKTSSAKAKGRRAAMEVRQKLLDAAPHLQPDDIAVASSGSTGRDVILSPEAQREYPFVIECKNCESLNIWKALEQAASHKRDREEAYPIVAFRRNRSELYVAMKLEDLLRLKGRWEAKGAAWDVISSVDWE